VACCSAALDARRTPDEADISLAARLVLAHRATRVPAESAPAPEPDQPADTPPEAATGQAPDAGTDATQPGSLKEKVVAAAQAVIPQDLLAASQDTRTGGRRPAANGGSGAPRRAAQRGRQIGTVAGDPAHGLRLDVLATLTAAAPWQRNRRDAKREGAALSIRRRDFRVKQFEQNSSCTTVFAVDASGSQALHRLAEAKGAVELLLRECYIRRDRVALLAFSGTGAQLLLAPTRSLVRARRCLASLPGGGGTPLAQGIESATQLATSLRRAGDTPAVVLLTDGRANITRQGKPDRMQARKDTDDAARRLGQLGIATVVVDTSLRPSAAAEAIAGFARARYVPLPHAGAEALARIAHSVNAGGR